MLDDAAGRSGWRVARDRVDAERYFADMQHSKVTFSPFGWGELCFRDFEAIRAGSVLVKPDMGHLETWPNIFVPGETYVPVRWDGADLADTIAHYLDHPEERAAIRRNAHKRLSEELAQVPNRAASVLAEAVAP